MVANLRARPDVYWLIVEYGFLPGEQSADSARKSFEEGLALAAQRHRNLRESSVTGILALAQMHLDNGDYILAGSMCNAAQRKIDASGSPNGIRQLGTLNGLVRGMESQ